MNKPLNELTPEDVENAINTHNVDLSREEYKKAFEPAKVNADNQDQMREEMEKQTAKLTGKEYVAPEKQEEAVTEELRHKRIMSNFCGTMINMLLPTFQMVNEITPIIYAIADKLGIDFEKVETAEDKAFNAAAEVLKAKKVEQDNQTQNRAQRRAKRK